MTIHNVLALSAARKLVHLIHSGGEWRQVFSGEHVSLSYVRSPAAWPLPDAVLVDGDDNETANFCAIEFKPPHSSKSECVRGLGQATTYLADYNCAALILPDFTVDGFPIANYLARLISTPVTAQKSIGVYAYPIHKVTSTLAGSFPLNLLKPIGGLAENLEHGRPPRLERVFWGFWRDFSLHEIYLAGQ